ncbi:Rz1-like lysis system protein LysC [Acinetobacter colistiniresistens]|uniref:Uncharacterized protein n=1 Tax=Acinetobacter colistiniresistens TaxID=280145 RepID=A0A558F0B4_9GAMM|nr:hypothetical protein [Acinetobacter colistiniresistens]TVT78629.1 hypothetical protein FPV60_16875 [Acinetobacter colistiniresistens]
MTACCRSTVLSKPVIPANLLEPCPQFSYLEGGTGKDALLWAVDTVAKGNECAAKVDAWIEIEKAR